MARVLVVGGAGFYGSRVVAMLRERGHEVAVASRSAGQGEHARRLDLSDPATFGALDGWDALVNCSDSVNADPEAAIRWVLEHGGAWFEMGADAPMTRRLSELRVEGEPRGCAVLGVGVFPGLSTLLARELAERGDSCERLELGIRLSPLSGGGWGIAALMSEMLFDPASWYEDGELRTGSLALGPTITLPFASGNRVGVLATLPDTALIHRATGAPNVGTYFALVPGFLRFNFLVISVWAKLLRPLRALVVWALTVQLALVRALLLRSVGSALELVVVADRGTPRERSDSLRFDDGQNATAAGTVAAVEAWLRLDERPRGVRGVAEVLRLDETWPLR